VATLDQVLTQVTDLVVAWTANQEQFADWMAGSATGGFNSTGTTAGGGYYPLSNSQGTTVYAPSIAKVMDAVVGPVAEANTLLDDVQTQVTAAQGFLDELNDRITEIVGYKNAAETAASAAAASQAAALASKNAAAGSETAALSYRNAAQSSKTAAEAAEVNAETAAADASTERQAAQTARSGAEAAQTAASASQTAAHNSEVAAEADRAEVAINLADVVSRHADIATKASQVESKRAEVASNTATVAADKATVAADKSTVATDRATVAADKATVAADKATTQGARDAAQAAQSAAEAARDSAETIVGFDIQDYQLRSEKGQANGFAALDSEGKVPMSQLHAELLGGLFWQSAWNAATNTPAIPPAATNNKGHYYKVSNAGSTLIDGINEWGIGDWIVSNGAAWDKIDNSDIVSSVAGKTGVVSLVKADVGLGSVDNTPDASKPISSAAQTALDSKQPLNSNLTSISALDTTSFGRGLLTTASASALTSLSHKIGDTIFTAGTPPEGFVPADDSSYLSSLYPEAAAVLPPASGTGLTSQSSLAYNAGLNIRRANGSIADNSFWACGDSGIVLRAYNGGVSDEWSPVDTNTTGTLRGIAVQPGGTNVVAVGDGGVILLRAGTGGTFVPQVSGVTTQLNDVAWDAIVSVFVAVGNGGVILTSPTGVTWTPRASGVTTDLLWVQYTQSRVVAGTTDGVIVAAGSLSAWTKVTIAAGKVFALGHWSIFQSALMVYTTDNFCYTANALATTWSGGASGLTDITSLANQSSYFIALRSDGSVYYATGPTSWTVTGTAVGFAGAGSALVVGSGTVLGVVGLGYSVSYGTTPATSKSGIVPWVLANGGPTRNIVAAEGPAHIVTANGSYIIRLTKATGAIGIRQGLASVSSVLWTGSQYVLAGVNMWTSPDAYTLTQRTWSGYGNALYLKQIGTDIVCLSYNGTTLYVTKSADAGVTWALMATVNIGASTPVGAAYAFGRLWVLGNDGQLFYNTVSTGWTNWVKPGVPAAFGGSEGRAILECDGQLAVGLAQGGSSTFAITSDGTYWDTYSTGGMPPSGMLYYSNAWCINRSDSTESQGTAVSIGGQGWSTIPGTGLLSGDSLVGGFWYNGYFWFLGNRQIERIPYSAASPPAFRAPFAKPPGANIRAYTKIH
jgi:hypothetical protein